MPSVPSISHYFLFWVLRALQVPKGLLSAMQAMYDGNEAFVEIGGQLIWLFSIEQGVLQGCPLSGTLFVFCVNVVLKMLDVAVGPGGSLRAFADDIAIVVKHIGHMKEVHAAFESFGRGTNLKLKPKKCVCVPLGAPWSDAREEVVRRLLTESAPSWSAFLIKPRAKYLGFWVGLLTKHQVWSEAANKWVSRALDLAHAGIAPSLAIREYNSRAVSCLGYLAQLKEPPEDMLKIERRVIDKIFHLMAQGLPPNMCFNLNPILNSKL